MFLRPQSVARSPATEIEGEDGPRTDGTPVFVSNEPIAALLDGLPVENHARLAGRLRVDDPEGLADIYPVIQREHGTEMASLIIHGNLNHGEPPLPRPLYVRPVFRPTQGGERTPGDQLIVDVIHQAVRRIKEGDGAEPAAAPQVVLINLSLADDKRPFARLMSPLGRLLDYLSWRYRVLFLVSAGNIGDKLKIEGYASWADFEVANPEVREKAVLASLNAHKGRRTLLSPAEFMNALTIGAAHAGSAFNGRLPAGRVDPFTAESVPNIISAMGLGFQESCKARSTFKRRSGTSHNGCHRQSARGHACQCRRTFFRTQSGASFGGRRNQFRRFHLGDKRGDSSRYARRTPHPRCPARPRKWITSFGRYDRATPPASESPDGSRRAMERQGRHAGCILRPARPRIASCAAR